MADDAAMRTASLAALLLVLAACGGKKDDSASKTDPTEGNGAQEQAEGVKPATDIAHEQTTDVPPSDDDKPKGKLSKMITELAAVGPIEPAKPGGGCNAVAAHLSKFAAAGVERYMKAGNKPAPKELEALKKDAIAQMQPLVERACRYEGWSQELRDCLLVATDKPSVEACSKLAATKPPPAATEADEPTCETVGKHFVKIMVSAGKTPDSAQAILDQLAADNTEQCRRDNWSQPARRCIVDAKDFPAVEKCMLMLMK